MVSQGILVRLEARAGQDAEVEAFLHGAREQVLHEVDTTAWFALRFGRTEYGMFAAFPGLMARDAHISGTMMLALRNKADTLFARQPQIQRLALLADKIPPHTNEETINTKALLLSFRAKAGHVTEVEQFLRDAKTMAAREAKTIAWFALHLENGEYGIFEIFPDSSGRFAHLTGQIPRALARHSLSLLGSMPDLELINVLCEKLPGQMRLLG